MIIKRDKVAITFKEEEYSYNQLIQYSTAYKETFEKNSERLLKVLIFSENCPEYIFASYGALSAAAIVVPVDVQSTASELAYIVDDCRPEVILTSETKKEFVLKVLESVASYPVAVLTPNDVNLDHLNSYPLDEITAKDPHQTLAIIYTSGTTGSPKGVMLSHENIMYNIHAVSTQIPIFREESNTMILLPLHHSFPFVGTMYAPLFAGGTVHIAEGLNSESILKTLHKGKISIMVGVPRLYETLAKGIVAKIYASKVAKTMYKIAGLLKIQAFSKAIFKEVHQKFGGHLESLVCGGAALPDDIAKIFQTLGFEVLAGYGMTECAPMISFTRPGEVKVGYSGRLLPSLEAKIIPETGEMAVRGPNVMQGYYNRPEETAQIIREDGWLYTGDVAVIDKYGVKITGRIKEIMVTSNGKNINPVEIEHKLMEKSTFMQEVAVFLYEDMLHALIYPNMSAVRVETGADIDVLLENEIIAYNKEATTYKRIKQFHVTSKELPKTRLGKTQRFKLEDYITNKNEEQDVEENLDGRSLVYLSLKEFLDNESGMNVKADDHFEMDLNIDSLGRVALIAYIETAFDISLPESVLDEFSTLEKLAAHVEKNAKTHGSGAVSWSEILKSRVKDFKVPSHGFVYWFIYHFLKLFFSLFYIFRAKGNENVSDKPCIIVGNHRSAFDGAFVATKLGWKTMKRTFFFAKSKHFKSRITQFLGGKSNVIVMDINANIRDSLQQMAEILRQGKNVIIFPEGTRSKDKQLKKFREAFAILSVELNVPILPVMISGAERATYQSFRFPRFLNKIVLHYQPLITPNVGETATDLCKRVEAMYKNMGK